DIEDLGYSTVDQLTERGLVKNIADLYSLTKEDFLSLEGFAEVSATKLYDRIQSAKEVPLHKFLLALGIPSVGKSTAKTLARELTLEELRDVTLEHLLAIQDIGPETAQSILQWFTDKDNLAMLDKFKDQGVVVVREEAPVMVSDDLKDEVIVITGTFSGLTRDEVKALLVARGAKVSGNLSGKTTMLLAGTNAGSKLSTAESMGIPIKGEAHLKDLL